MKKFIIGKVDKVMMALWIVLYRNAKWFRPVVHRHCISEFHLVIGGDNPLGIIVFGGPDNDTLYETFFLAYGHALKDHWPIDMVEDILASTHTRLRREFDSAYSRKK